VTLHGVPVWEFPPGKAVVFAVFHAAFNFALGAGAPRGARTGREAPVIGKGPEFFIQLKFTRGAVVLFYQRPGVVYENFLRDAAEVAERSL
jgi:hypothetical protein